MTAQITGLEAVRSAREEEVQKEVERLRGEVQEKERLRRKLKS